jgi:hypothetical protein
VGTDGAAAGGGFAGVGGGSATTADTVGDSDRAGAATGGLAGAGGGGAAAAERVMPLIDRDLPQELKDRVDQQSPPPTPF